MFSMSVKYFLTLTSTFPFKTSGDGRRLDSLVFIFDRSSLSCSTSMRYWAIFFCWGTVQWFSIERITGYLAVEELVLYIMIWNNMMYMETVLLIYGVCSFHFLKNYFNTWKWYQICWSRLYSVLDSCIVNTKSWQKMYAPLDGMLLFYFHQEVHIFSGQDLALTMQELISL